MRDDRLRLRDILEAIDLAVAFTSAKAEADLKQDLLLQNATLHQLYIIGEACSRISANLKARHPGVPWRAVTDFRNYIAHEYFALDLNVVWQTLTRDLPNLKIQIAEITKTEFL